MRRPSWIFPALLMGLACQRPELDAFKRNPTPMVVRFHAPENLSVKDQVEREYAAALRARLATRAVVVPEGVKAPGSAVELVVEVRDIHLANRKSSNAAAVGVITGVAVGALSKALGNRDAVFDGFFWGLWAGTHAHEEQRWNDERLGFRPQRVDATVRLMQPGVSGALWAFEVDGREVIDAMDPLPSNEREDPDRIQEEEAKAFARVVTARLQERFNWITWSEPRWYKAPKD
jgi:hypothetical protein